MTEPLTPPTGFNRRDFVAMAGAGLSAGVLATGASAQGLEESHQISQPAPAILDEETTADIVVETLITWGVTHVFGIVGDGINSLIEALRTRQDRITFIGTRHEEAAAFMACAMAKHTGRLGVCFATTGPGAVHLMNGLYDAACDNAPVLAITGSTFRDLSGMSFMQGLEPVKVMQDVALFNEQVNGPDHAIFVVNRAIRSALGRRGVAHLSIAKDVQALKRSAEKPSAEDHNGRTASSWSPVAGTPPIDQLRAAAEILNSGKRVAILAGSGCFPARAQLRRVADLLGAPIAKAYLAKALLPDNDPLTTGGIGHLGTLPSMQAMHECDTVLILGTMMPWIDYYPKPGQARGVQVDIKPENIGVKFPVEIGLTGDVAATLDALLPMLRRKSDRSFLAKAQQGMREWNGLLGRITTAPQGAKLDPRRVCRVLSNAAPTNAVFSLDTGINTHFAARMVELRDGQRWSGSGTLMSMGSGLPYAIAAAFAFPDRPSIAIVGDGGLSMLMAELSTAVLNKLNVKVIVLNNDAYGEVIFEQKEIGNPAFGCDLGHIDFAMVARAVGAKGFTAATASDLDQGIRAWLAAPGVALLDVAVDVAVQSMAPDKLSAAA